jgi:hypothetical protein
VEKTNWITKGDWRLTGAITFYESEIGFKNVQILESGAEDAINIINGSYKIQNSEFGYSASDAFDADFSDGIIVNSSFHDIQGDGVDVSGSELVISDTNFININDKAISIGEASQLTSRGLSITNVGIGLACKDSSTCRIGQSSISNSSTAGLAAFVKKAEYGPASVYANEITLYDVIKEAIVQTGSEIILNGVVVSTEELDVDLLYELDNNGKK